MGGGGGQTHVKKRGRDQRLYENVKNPFNGLGIQKKGKNFSYVFVSPTSTFSLI